MSSEIASFGMIFYHSLAISSRQNVPFLKYYQSLITSSGPTRIAKFLVEDDDRDWKPQWLEQLKQVDLFTRGGGETDKEPRVPVDKIPYKFKYRFEDDEGRSSTMTIEDWEVGALYRNCLARAEGNEGVATQKVVEKYDAEFRETKDLSLFLGTTLSHHQKRHSNPFTIIGIFYPPKNPQEGFF